MLIDIYKKFPEDSMNSFQVRGGHDFMRDRQMPGGKTMSPYPKGGRHNYTILYIYIYSPVARADSPQSTKF